jgi:Arabinose efflux permease
MSFQYSIKNTSISKVMLISLFIDEWNIFSIPMISIFVEHSLQFGTSFLGFITGATVGGASIGSILGGYMVDRFGRKKLFFFNLGLFLISAILSAFSINLAMLVIFRFLAGIPAGADISNVYSYIMETEKPGHREVTGAYNTLMASMAILGLNGSVVILMISGLQIQ